MADSECEECKKEYCWPHLNKSIEHPRVLCDDCTQAAEKQRAQSLRAIELSKKDMRRIRVLLQGKDIKQLPAVCRAWGTGLVCHPDQKSWFDPPGIIHRACYFMRMKDAMRVTAVCRHWEEQRHLMFRYMDTIEPGLPEPRRTPWCLETTENVYFNKKEMRERKYLLHVVRAPFGTLSYSSRSVEKTMCSWPMRACGGGPPAAESLIKSHTSGFSWYLEASLIHQATASRLP